ncbi:MAG: fluoride efflux transporter CrcB [bacterium]|nr:fluoride efflux transporter CrcB [Gammaproteobacteria bacterium]
MAELVAIAIGGALGAVARFSLGNVINGLVGTQFPYGILLVNVLGSLLIGVFFELLVEDRLFPPVYRSVIIVGFLGAFTTFSTFSMQVVGLLETGRFGTAAIYTIASVALSVVAVILGIFVTRQLTS